MNRHKLLWLNLRTISTFPNYVRIIKDQANMGRTTISKNRITYTKVGSRCSKQKVLKIRK